MNLNIVVHVKKFEARCLTCDERVLIPRSCPSCPPTRRGWASGLCSAWWRRTSCWPNGTRATTPHWPEGNFWGGGGEWRIAFIVEQRSHLMLSAPNGLLFSHNPALTFTPPTLYGVPGTLSGFSALGDRDERGDNRTSSVNVSTSDNRRGRIGTGCPGYRRRPAPVRQNALQVGSPVRTEIGGDASVVSASICASRTAWPVAQACSATVASSTNPAPPVRISTLTTKFQTDPSMSAHRPASTALQFPSQPRVAFPLLERKAVRPAHQLAPMPVQLERTRRHPCQAES
jgi:hypothetical protein